MVPKQPSGHVEKPIYIGCMQRYKRGKYSINYKMTIIDKYSNNILYNLNNKRFASEFNITKMAKI
jgi:hypothetical protein